MSTCSHENNPHPRRCFITENSTWRILQGWQSTTWNYPKILQESQFLELGPSSLAQEKHDICDFFHMTAFDILIIIFLIEKKTAWDGLTHRASANLQTLTQLSIPQDFARKPATPGTRNCPPAQQKDKRALSHMKTFHMLILSYSEQHMDYIYCCTLSNFGHWTT